MEQFYKEVYGGRCLEGEQLQEFLLRAEEELAALERSYEVREAAPDGRRKAICAMAEALHYFDTAQNGTGGLRYMSVGTVSVSGKGVYSAVDISPAAARRELYRCAGLYMDIYRGKRG
jgi:hypothetical protein